MALGGGVERAPLSRSLGPACLLAGDGDGDALQTLTLLTLVLQSGHGLRDHTLTCGSATWWQGMRLAARDGEVAGVFPRLRAGPRPAIHGQRARLLRDICVLPARTSRPVSPFRHL